MALRTAGVFLGISAFTGSHLVLSHPPIRQDLIDKLGKDRFKGLYSLVAVSTLLPTAFFYARYGRGAGVQLWKGNSWWQRSAGFGFKALGALTFSQAVIAPNAIIQNANRPGTADSTITEDDVKVQGIYRVSRHATFMSFALLGVGNLLTRGHLSDVIFWGSFPVYWLVGSSLQDERLKLTYPKSFFEQTSLLPGQAIIEGKQSWKEAVSEMSPRAALLALLAPIFFL
eukprot:jgi/Hompol1/1373/HPOL_005583-RA